jgi:hypothetical protein
MAPWQETVAVQDFGLAYDRYGSFTTDAVEATRASLSAVARKRTNGPLAWDVRFVPLVDICSATNRNVIRSPRRRVAGDATEPRDRASWRS